MIVIAEAIGLLLQTFAEAFAGNGGWSLRRTLVVLAAGAVVSTLLALAAFTDVFRQ